MSSVPPQYQNKISDVIYNRLFGPTLDPQALTGRKVPGKPFIFTSTYMLDKVTGAINGTAESAISSDISSIIGNNPEGNAVASATIPMAINPQSIRWSQPKRIKRKDTMRGATFFHFSDKNGQNNDILTLAISGTTGNIWNRDPDNKKKLLIWHMLYQMSREPMHYRTTVNGQSVLKTNQQFIMYQTPLFPTQIQMIGFFSRVLEFEENAENPHMRDFTMEFTVTATNPSLDAIITTIL